MARTGPDWTKDEFDALRDTVLRCVASGLTLEEALDEFCASTGHVRSRSAARYKFVTKILPNCREEYEEARRIGAVKRAEREAEKQEQEQETPTITQRDLIRWLRGVRIVADDDADMRRELEQIRAELAEARLERDELKSELERLRAELAAVTRERDDLLRAFRIARRHVAGIESTGEFRAVILPDGTVERRRPD